MALVNCQDLTMYERLRGVRERCALLVEAKTEHFEMHYGAVLPDNASRVVRTAYNTHTAGWMKKPRVWDPV